ncbi:trehalose-phosphatase [soil metagenome]
MSGMADIDRLPPLPVPPLALMKGASLFLDFDGTLVPLTDVPEAVEVDPALHALLRRLHVALDGRLAIVSGRSVAVLRNLFGLRDFTLAGSHGLEFAQPDAAPHAPQRLEAVDEAQAKLLAFAADKPGLLIERKTLSVGLHFRQAPQWAEACRELAERLARETGLFLQIGKMLYELRPGGADKGSAIRHLMREAPMLDGIPVFLGDDVTDEDGFAAAVSLRGNGILIGPERATKAQWRLEHVDAVRHYLNESVAHLTS